MCPFLIVNSKRTSQLEGDHCSNHYVGVRHHVKDLVGGIRVIPIMQVSQRAMLFDEPEHQQLFPASGVCQNSQSLPAKMVKANDDPSKWMNWMSCPPWWIIPRWNVDRQNEDPLDKLPGRDIYMYSRSLLRLPSVFFWWLMVCANYLLCTESALHQYRFAVCSAYIFGYMGCMISKDTRSSTGCPSQEGRVVRLVENALWWFAMVQPYEYFQVGCLSTKRVKHTIHGRNEIRMENVKKRELTASSNCSSFWPTAPTARWTFLGSEIWDVKI